MTHRLALLVILTTWVVACGTDPDGDATDPGPNDVMIWADVGDSGDSWAPIVDTFLPPDVGGGIDAGRAIDTWAADAPDAAALPKPATVPGNLPSGIIAIGVSSLALGKDGSTPLSELILPPKTSAWLAVVLGAHPGLFGLGTVLHPLAGFLAQGTCTALCVSCKNRIGAAPASGAALFPSSSGVVINGGSWQVGSCGFVWKQEGGVFSPQPAAGAKVDTVVFARVGPVPTKGRLRLRLFFAGPSSASASHTDPRVGTMLARSAAILATAAIEQQVIGRHDVPGGPWVVSLPAGLTLTGASNADSLFAAAGPLGGAALLDVFVVSALAPQPLPSHPTLAWSGGVPGPAFYHGIPRAGVVVALPADPALAPLAGRGLARAIGHFLGLWVTSTPKGKRHDPLADTPECTPIDDKNSDGLVDRDECAAKGGDNPMFWGATIDDPLEVVFTAEQGRILRGNPLVIHP